MSEIINRFNLNSEINKNIESVYNDELYTSSEDEDDIKEDKEDINLQDNIYVIKVNEQIKCYCSSIEELDETVEVLIEKLKYKYLLNGWNIISNIKNKKSTWKIIDTNKIVTQIFGNKPNLLINYDIILSEIEVEIIKKITNKNLLQV